MLKRERFASKAQKGKVRVESSEGNGTSFILEIPFGEQSKAAA